MRGKLWPPIDLAAVAVPPLVWPAFDNGPTAFYVLQGLLVAYLGFRLRSLGWQWIPVSWFAAFVGGQQAVCGALYVADGGHICDAGTHLPFSVITALSLTLCVLYYRSRHG